MCVEPVSSWGFSAHGLSEVTQIHSGGYFSPRSCIRAEAFGGLFGSYYSASLTKLCCVICMCLLYASIRLYQEHFMVCDLGSWLQSWSTVLILPDTWPGVSLGQAGSYWFLSRPRHRCPADFLCDVAAVKLELRGRRVCRENRTGSRLCGGMRGSRVHSWTDTWLTDWQIDGFYTCWNCRSDTILRQTWCGKQKHLSGCWLKGIGTVEGQSDGFRGCLLLILPFSCSIFIESLVIKGSQDRASGRWVAHKQSYSWRWLHVSNVLVQTSWFCCFRLFLMLRQNRPHCEFWSCMRLNMEMNQSISWLGYPLCCQCFSGQRLL